MRPVLFLVITLLVGVVLSTTASATQPPVATALLTLEDLPEGWSEHPPAAADDESPWLCGVDPVLRGAEPAESGEVSFAQGGFGSVLHQVVSRTAEAAVLIERMQALPVPCEWSEADADGEETRWRMEAIALPPLGEQSLAFRLSTALEDLAYLETEIALIRRGDVVSMLLIESVGLFSPPEPQTALLESLARLIDERLATITG